MQEAHIIAEAGTNHNGRLDTAKQLVDVAVASRASSVKFQIIYPEGLYLPRFYTNGQYTDNAVFQKRAEGMLTDDEYRMLAAYCAEKHIPFSASVFDRRGIELLDELEASYIKIASCDLNNSYLLKMAAERGRQLVISTGMASLGEIERAVKDVMASGNHQVALMHCVSVYPAPTERMNLAFLKVLKEAFGLPVGLSDHTENSIAGVIAISMGAAWIEKHFTLDRSSEGFDHAYAMEPAPFAAYIADLRAAAAACARWDEKLDSAELAVSKRARRSLYAARDLTPGEVLTESDVLIVRPEGPLQPNDLPLILGRTVKQPVRQYAAFSLDAFC